jgi:hypothetical protein
MKFIPKDKIVTINGRDIRLNECSQEQLAKLVKLFPHLIDEKKQKENDLSKPQRSKPDDSLDAE